ncbi:sulfotransferase [Thalassotalea euphylliae]|uniref:sulfotransferase n=1 Tax=Thalassotalea euphylliae TaxID=1655234 RepID=UPI00362644B8
MSVNKVWIIGLPRTATTSVCVASLGLGLKTAHTAYTQDSIKDSQVVADTPIFADYQALDKLYPNSKFVNLVRNTESWVPSIRQLLLRMFDNLQRDDGGFNPYLKRCYNQVFAPLTIDNIHDDSFLIDCYNRHQKHIAHYFIGRNQDLLTIDIKDKDSFDMYCAFLDVIPPHDHPGFERINIGGKVTAWNKIKHPLKIASTRNGRIDSALY